MTPTAPELVEYPDRTPPVRVQIADADIDMSIVPVGKLENGFMELPSNVDVAGWYRYSSTPASGSGNTVIAAHVDSLEYGLGPFVRLKELEKGTRIVVTSENGESRQYEVTGVENFEKGELPVDEIFERDGEPGLVLITCGGTFDRENLRYSDNVVLTATPVES